MRTINTIKTFGIILCMIGVAACNDSSSDPKPGGSNDNKPVEGSYVGTWLLPNENMPTDEMKNGLEKMVLVVDEQDNYTWTWTKKTGEETVFEGKTSEQKTKYKHSSGASIWLYSIYVNTINGKYFPGGWDGIFTFEGADNLVINVEPSVSNWDKYPQAEEGVGSGASGEKSVYRFVRQ